MGSNPIIGTSEKRFYEGKLIKLASESTLPLSGKLRRRQ
jgi:hypothetical protein